MLVYRITLKPYSVALAAPGFAGRWNGSGRKVVYAAESIPLAFMENMIQRKGVGFNDQFAIMIIEVPDDLSIEQLDLKGLPTGWRDSKDYSICQALGNDWYDKGVSPVLKVPSAILTTNFNFVINATHPEFHRIKLMATTDFVPDERIEEILHRYNKAK